MNYNISSLLIDPPPAQIQINTTQTLPRFVAENQLQSLALKQAAYGVVVIRWNKIDFQHSQRETYQGAQHTLLNTLKEAQIDRDLLFASGSCEVGITLIRESVNHLHFTIRDLLHMVRKSQFESYFQKSNMVCNTLNLKIGWAVSSNSLKGREVLRTAEQRSYQTINYL